MARLSRENWLDHALEQLSINGFTSLKAETLAKSLGISRGSFYWHFENLAVFHEAVLQHWLVVSVTRIVDKLEAEDLAPETRLQALANAAAEGDRNLEQAMRAWSLSNTTVKSAVEMVDRERIAYIIKLLNEMKIPKQEQSSRASHIYLTSLGWSMVSDVVSENDTRAVIQSVLEMAAS